jgi:hypothetical protein
MKGIKLFPLEEFREIEIDPNLKLRYAISNHARLVSFSDEIKFGKILKGSMQKGYHIIRFKIYKEGTILNTHRFYYKMVAETFLEKPTENQVYILHNDFNRGNDKAANLKYATRNEMLEHQRNSPHVKKHIKNLLTAKHNAKAGSKLTVAKVKTIKQVLASESPPTQFFIAQKFGVSGTQIKRIQRGENWAQVII